MKNLSLLPKTNHALVCLLVLAVSVGAQSKTKMRHAHSLEATDPAISDAFLAFHTCEALGVEQMRDWWTNSPYYAAGIYIGGVSRSCSNDELDARWVTKVMGQGWGLIPLWSGEQAPCARRCVKWDKDHKKCLETEPFPHRFTPENAATEGKLEAAEAIAAAEDLGLANSIIYYDMEYYDQDGDDGACGTAATAFVGAWTEELVKNNFAAGVYGSPIDAKANFAKSKPFPPDDVWLTRFTPTNQHYILPEYTIWGLKPLCDPFSKPNCDLWSDGQRINQYAGEVYRGKDWGTGDIKVDLDVVDGDFVAAPEFRDEGEVSAPSEDKTYTFEYKTIPLPSNIDGSLSEASGINNAGQVVGWYTPLKKHIIQPSVGFLYIDGKVTSFSYACEKDECNTLGTGINNAGQVVGSVCNEVTNACWGFLYFKGSFTSFSIGSYACTYPYGINDAGQVVGVYGDYPSCADGSFLYDINTRVSTILPQSVGNAYAINGDALILDVNLLYNPVTGTSTPLNFQATGFNNNLEFVGLGAVYDRDGNESPVNYPEASVTQPIAINDLTQVVGYYITSANEFYQFVATPKTVADEQEVLLTQPTQKR